MYVLQIIFISMTYLIENWVIIPLFKEVIVDRSASGISSPIRGNVSWCALLPPSIVSNHGDSCAFETFWTYIISIFKHYISRRYLQILVFYLDNCIILPILFPRDNTFFLEGQKNSIGGDGSVTPFLKNRSLKRQDFTFGTILTNHFGNRNFLRRFS